MAKPTRRSREGEPAVSKKIVKWGGIALLVFFVASRPQSAAGIVHSIGSTLMNAASGLGDFFATVLG
jgi:hypothetical protein